MIYGYKIIDYDHLFVFQNKDNFVITQFNSTKLLKDGKSG